MMLADRYVISQYCCRGVQAWHRSHSPAHATVKLRINTPYVQTGLSPGQDWVSTRPHWSLITPTCFRPVKGTWYIAGRVARVQNSVKRTCFAVFLGAGCSLRKGHRNHRCIHGVLRLSSSPMCWFTANAEQNGLESKF